MVKRSACQMKDILLASKAKMPNLEPTPAKMSFKECKRRSILSGLRMLKAPAVTRQKYPVPNSNSMHLINWMVKMKQLKPNF